MIPMHAQQPTESLHECDPTRVTAADVPLLGDNDQPGFDAADPIEAGQVASCNGTRIVLMRVPPAVPVRGPQAVQGQRDTARRALQDCARINRAPLDGWTQRPDGAPVSNNGWHWSIAHKRLWAGAVIARAPVGLDIEALIPRNADLFTQIADDREWELIGGPDWIRFFQIWTAKEATLKANGVGIGAWEDCRLMRVTTGNDPQMTVTFRQRAWRVEHTCFDDHIAAVARNARSSD